MKSHIERVKLSFYNPYTREHEMALKPPEYIEDKINELIDAVNKLLEEVRSLKNQTNEV